MTCNSIPTRKLVVTVQLTVNHHRHQPPTDREIREYIQTSLVETEYHESDMHVHAATVTGWGPQHGLAYDEAPTG